MALGEVFENGVVSRIAALGQTGALEELIGHALKRRDHDHHRLARVALEHDMTDVAHARRITQGRAAEFEDLHASNSVTVVGVLADACALVFAEGGHGRWLRDARTGHFRRASVVVYSVTF